MRRRWSQRRARRRSSAPRQHRRSARSRRSRSTTTLQRVDCPQRFPCGPTSPGLRASSSVRRCSPGKRWNIRRATGGSASAAAAMTRPCKRAGPSTSRFSRRRARAPLGRSPQALHPRWFGWSCTAAAAAAAAVLRRRAAWCARAARVAVAALGSRRCSVRTTSGSRSPSRLAREEQRALAARRVLTARRVARAARRRSRAA